MKAPRMFLLFVRSSYPCEKLFRPKDSRASLQPITMQPGASLSQCSLNQTSPHPPTPASPPRRWSAILARETIRPCEIRRECASEATGAIRPHGPPWERKHPPELVVSTLSDTVGSRQQRGRTACDSTGGEAESWQRLLGKLQVRRNKGAQLHEDKIGSGARVQREALKKPLL